MKVSLINISCNSFNLSTNNALFVLHCLMSYSMLLSMQVFVIDQFIFSFIINTA